LNRSEKYEFKVRNWKQEGIRSFVRSINRIRRANPALQEYDNLKFIKTENDQILGYVKAVANPAIRSVLLILVNLDPAKTQISNVYFPLTDYGMDWRASYKAHDLLTDKLYTWQGEKNYVELTPENPVHIFRIEG